MKKKTKTEPTLKSMTALYKKRGFKRPAAHAKQYMIGYTAAKKGFPYFYSTAGDHICLYGYVPDIFRLQGSG